MFSIPPNAGEVLVQWYCMMNFPSAQVPRPSTKNERLLETVAAVAVMALALFFLVSA